MGIHAMHFQGFAQEMTSRHMNTGVKRDLDDVDSRADIAGKLP
jgi:hypothetical protein